jgi:NitT/TauT family transport system substrate-binding protein
MRVAALACLAVLVLAAGGFVPAAAQTDAGATVLRIATTADDNSVPVLFAQRTGRFKAAGLDVQIQQVANGAAIAAGIAGGSYDIGKASLTSILTAHLRGVPFTIVGAAGIYDAKAPYGVLLVPSDSPVHTAKDLEGATLASGGLNSIDEVAVRAWMERNGADPRAVHFVEIPQSAQQAALEAHRIAGAVTNRPQLDAALAGGKVRVLAPVFSAIAPTFMSSGWFATTDWADKHPEALARFLRVLVDTSRYANEHHAETAPILAAFSGVPLAVIEANPRTILGTSLDVAAVQPVIDLAAKYGLLQRPFPAREVLYVPAR